MNQGIPVQAIITHNTYSPLLAYTTSECLIQEDAIEWMLFKTDNIWYEGSAKISRIVDIRFFRAQFQHEQVCLLACLQLP